MGDSLNLSFDSSFNSYFAPMLPVNRFVNALTNVFRQIFVYNICLSDSVSHQGTKYQL